MNVCVRPQLSIYISEHDAIHIICAEQQMHARFKHLKHSFLKASKSGRHILNKMKRDENENEKSRFWCEQNRPKVEQRMLGECKWHGIL